MTDPNLEDIDRQLLDAIRELDRRAGEEHWEDFEITAAQELLITTAGWMRGFRPPAHFGEAWRRINDRRAKGTLRGPGYSGPDR